MYEEHIETLNAVREFTVNPRWHMAADAAIELFRAAQPKDEQAEREHCRVKAVTIDGRKDTARLIMRERAQARAEGYASARNAYEGAAVSELQALRTHIIDLSADVADWKQRAEKAEHEAREAVDACIADSVETWRRSHRFGPDAVSALLVLIEDAHMRAYELCERQWTALKLAVKRVRASERNPKA